MAAYSPESIVCICRKDQIVSVFNPIARAICATLSPSSSMDRARAALVMCMKSIFGRCDDMPFVSGMSRTAGAVIAGSAGIVVLVSPMVIIESFLISEGLIPRHLGRFEHQLKLQIPRCLRWGDSFHQADRWVINCRM